MLTRGLMAISRVQLIMVHIFIPVYRGSLCFTRVSSAVCKCDEGAKDVVHEAEKS